MPTFYARTETVGTGAQVDFTINWSYLETSHVKAAIGGVVTTAFTVAGNTVTFASAPANGVGVVIYRATSLATVETFARLGTPSSGTFNSVMRRLQYIAQEASDAAQVNLAAVIPTLPTFASVAEMITGTAIDKIANPDNVASLWEQGTDIASASPLVVPTTGGGYFFVTGTTNFSRINEATTKTGRRIEVKFAGALTITHGTNIKLPGAANITTAADDVAVFRCEDTTSNNQVWRCVQYTKANGTAVVSPSAATDTTQGIVELATNAEAITGTDTVRAVTPAALLAALDNRWKTVARQNASNVAQVDVTGLASYNHNRITIRDGRPVTDDTFLRLRFESGGSWQTANYEWSIQSAGTGYSGSAAAHMATTSDDATATTGIKNSTASWTFQAEINIHNASASGTYLHWVTGWITWRAANGTAPRTSLFSGWWTGGTGTITGLRSFMNSGNLSVGEWVHEGRNL